MIFRPGISLSDHEIYQLAALAPGCTYNHIVNGQIEQKLRLSTPSFLRDIA
jgi:aspartate carbamoyltransferase regulatory subunit